MTTPTPLALELAAIGTWGMIDFQAVASSALTRAAILVPEWLPSGKLHGNEWVVGSIRGEPGKSLSINVKTGAWSDFANPLHKGGDLISLYATINGITQAEAARQLSEGHETTAVAVTKSIAADDWIILSPVPDDAPERPSEHPKHGEPVHVARYRDKARSVAWRRLPVRTGGRAQADRVADVPEIPKRPAGVEMEIHGQTASAIWPRDDRRR